jgi:hypothetical protein
MQEQGDEEASIEQLEHRIVELLPPVIAVLEEQLRDQGFVQVSGATFEVFNSDSSTFTLDGHQEWRHPDGLAAFRARVRVRCYFNVTDWSGVLAAVEFVNARPNQGTPGLLGQRRISAARYLPDEGMHQHPRGSIEHALAVAEGLPSDYVLSAIEEALHQLAEATAL